MRLETLRLAMQNQLNQPVTQRRFKAGRDRHSVLSDFATAQEVIDFLHLGSGKDRTPADFQRRSAVTAALIAEAQRLECDTWGLLLLLAYFPGILGIRATMRPLGHMNQDELDSLLLASFLETVATLPLATQGRLAVVNLILGTRKAVWISLVRESTRAAREEPLAFGANEVLLARYPSPEQFALANEAHEALAPTRIREWLRDILWEEADEDLELMLATHASGRPLVDWVREQRPDLHGGAFVREYARLRRRRSRLLERLRRRFNGESMSHTAPEMALLYRGLRAGA